MADKDDIKEGKDYGIGIPQANKAFYVKGSGALDWGMQNRLARIFNPASGRTVMLAFDHGYFQGPTTGLERIDLSIVPFALMCIGMPGSTVVGDSPARLASRVSSPVAIVRAMT